MRVLTISFFLYFFLGLSQMLMAAQTRVQGKISGFEGKRISAYIYEDYFSRKEQRLTFVKIENEAFQLNLDLETTEQLILRIEDKSTSLFVEPGDVYNIELSYDDELNQGKIYDRQLSIFFSFPRAEAINQRIAAFNLEYEIFFRKYYQQFVIGSAQSATKTFVDSILRKPEYQQHPFVKDYVRYAMANLMDIASIDRQSLYERFLKGQAQLYRNKEYINFFSQFYTDKFQQLVISNEATPLRRAIMIDEDRSKAIAYLQEKMGIEERALAELFLIFGLKEVYHLEALNRKSNLNMLQMVADDSEQQENRIIAKNFIQQLTLFRGLKEAPDFTLFNLQSNDSLQLSSLQGKPVYLSFWAEWSVPSLMEMKVINRLQEKYGEKIHFVSVNLDDEVKNSERVKAQNNYQWPFLYYGGDFELKEKYQLRTIPTYFLIAADGSMLEAPARSPVDIEKRLYDLSR